MNAAELETLFQSTFGSGSYRSFFAPGRINLIGEHTDYNGGHVFPCAITYGTYALAAKRSDRMIRMYSVNFPDKGIVECPLDDLAYRSEDDWANYPKGMIAALKERGYAIEEGLDLLIYGNIPNGAGLSSSASVEMVTGVMLEKLFNLKIDRIDMVKLGQVVENQYIGVNSGIMDQFAIGMGKKACGMLLDCQTLNYRYAPIELDHHVIVIMNTNKRRELAGSKYNERRGECEEALRILQEKVPAQSLGELSAETFERYASAISSETVRKRARHAVSENERTIQALEALERNDLYTFGELMNASHRSLRDDYEVTGKELDALVEAAWKQNGVIGARMTGAGFGGCAIAIVEKTAAEDFLREVGRAYLSEIGYEASFYIANIGDGACEIELGVHI
ncbi:MULTISPECIES: galactokinase [Metabacillus]|uniref:Galactokinase n=1 Tax=Metabacillus indicus TaxID=246786 RepID=A0A084H1C7_METID|nr:MULTISPECIES: galactokinase [Metabacillus]KEZ48213.1 galactokinase [Metabacillus indicus LMG 22858]KEZ53389.1 galactokinase [Metabacillus indicus]